jgi:hypothetical protein
MSMTTETPEQVNDILRMHEVQRRRRGMYPVIFDRDSRLEPRGNTYG